MQRRVINFDFIYKFPLEQRHIMASPHYDN